MAGIDRIIDGVKEVLRMTDEVKRLSEGLKSLAIEVREIDRRLVRIETMAEIARSQAGRQSKRLT
jgi:hypothetical protein